MNLRRIFLYNVLPKKRILLAFIGFLISSTIISGAGILMSSIVNSTASYLGESESILVISNPEASTPYTSIIPLELTDTINSIDGVLEVSPEVMTAAVYKDKAVYFRGVDASSFWYFTELTYQEGQLLTVNDTFEVSVGINFAQRNNLEVGDYITLFSTRSEAAIELKIKSIFSSNTLLDDEIIASLWIGQFFAFEDFNYITHIRVEIDLDVIADKEMLREVVLSEYELTARITTPGDLQELNASVYVYNKRGDLVNETIILNDIQVSFILPFGEYELQCQIKDVISNSTKLLLDKDMEAEISISYIERSAYFRIITDEDEPIQGADVALYRQGSTGFTDESFSDVTNSTGEVSLSISDGSYVGIISYGIYRKEITFSTSEVNNFEIILITRHPEIIAINPTNNSVVIGKNIDIKLFSSPGYSIYFYWDDNVSTIEEFYLASPGEEAPNYITIPFEQGSHSLTIETYNLDYIISGYNKSLNYATSKVFFTVIEAIPEEYYFINTMNGSHLNPASVVILNSTQSFGGDFFYSWGNNQWFEVSSDVISVPIEIGIYSLKLRAEIGYTSKLWDFVFVITDNPETIGILGLNEHMRLGSSSEIQTWFNPQYEAYYHWNTNSDTSLNQSGIIKPNGLDEGNNTLYLSFFNSVSWTNRSYNYVFDKSPPSISLSSTNGSEINFESILAVSTNETLSSLEFSWDGLSYSKSYEQNIRTPQTNGNHTLAIRAIDLAGNSIVSVYEYIVVNFTGSIPIDFYLKNEYSGIINQGYVDIEAFYEYSPILLEYQISGVISKASRIMGSTRVYLYPGYYSMKIIYWSTLFDKREQTWNFNIQEGLNSSLFKSEYLNETYTGETYIEVPFYDVNFTIDDADTVQLCDGYYSLKYQLKDISSIFYVQKFTVDTELPYVNVLSPHKAEEGLDANLILESDAVQIFFKIDNEPVYEYDRVYSLQFTSGGEHTISFFLTDSFNNTRTVLYVFNMDHEKKDINITIERKISDVLYPISNLSVTIYDSFNSPAKYLTTDNNGSVFASVFEGEIYVVFSYSDTLYNFTMDTSLSSNQSIVIGSSFTKFVLRDFFANSSIVDQYCTIRDLSGRRFTSLISNSQGEIVSYSLPSGDYICYFTRRGEATIAIPFEIYGIDNIVLFEMPSKRQLVTFKFRFDNSSKIYNLPVIINTDYGSSILASTSLDSKIQVYLSFGYVTLTIFLSDGSTLELHRIFEPGREIISIILPSDSDDQWSKIPFKPVAGFSFIIAFSTEYLDYYLRGSLLFTYTLAYAEIALILVVVIVNMYSILHNMYKESRRETTIIKMIGGTNLHTLISTFSRLGLVALIASIIGYGFGTLILKILSGLNQTIFFGHSFIPKGSWNIFLLNVALILFVAIIAAILIARKAGKDRTTVSVRR